MDLSGINNTTTLVTDVLAVISIFLILLVLFTDKKLSSMSIVLLVFCVGEGISSILLPHLKTLSGYTEDYGYAGWYIGWMLQFIVWLFLLLKLHQHLKMHLSNMALVIAWYYVACIVVQGIDFIDRLTLDSGFFADAYQLINLLLSLSIIPLVGLVYWIELYKHRALAKMQEA